MPCQHRYLEAVSLILCRESVKVYRRRCQSACLTIAILKRLIHRRELTRLEERHDMRLSHGKSDWWI